VNAFAPTETGSDIFFFFLQNVGSGEEDKKFPKLGGKILRKILRKIHHFFCVFF
jgi:hypothetical protein